MAPLRLCCCHWPIPPRQTRNAQGCEHDINLFVSGPSRHDITKRCNVDEAVGTCGQSTAELTGQNVPSFGRDRELKKYATLAAGLSPTDGIASYRLLG